LGKYFSYLKDVNDEQLAIDKSALTSKQFKTLSALKHIIDVSDDVSRGFFNEVSSEESDEEITVFYMVYNRKG
jgi:hypothetical protein